MVYFNTQNMLYTDRYINIISFFIAVIIFLILDSILFDNSKIDTLKIQVEKIFDKIYENQINQNEENNIAVEQNNIQLGNWYIEIPKINLSAPIAEGTSQEILKSNIGHLENTPLENGNIVLTAYNKGHENNFFENLKNLRKDDEIIYTHGKYKMTYVIDKIEIIEETDTSYLSSFDEDKITLITGIENQTQYKRYVQATSLIN